MTRSFDLDVDDSGPRSRDVFILGAGFSIAISGQMPTTAQLREHSDARLSVTAQDWLRVRGLHQVENFEVVLSELAVPQPYLDDRANLRNQAVFAEYSHAMHDAIAMCETKALKSDCPPWLARFVTTAHFQRSTLVTFNYDTLIESAVQGGHATLAATYNHSQLAVADWSELLKDQPPLPPGPGRFAADRSPTAQLLKLHGSTNWYWTAGDVYGSTLNRAPNVGSFGHPLEYTEDARQHELPGRVPFIVPPTAIKSAYYGLPLTKELWNRAHRALSEAAHVTAIGYSFPATDLTTLGLLRSALDADQCVNIVNPDAEKVADRLYRLGINTEAGFAGDGAVERFVDEWVAAVSTTIGSQLEQRGLDDLPLAVAWGSDSFAAVTSVDVCDGTLVLRTEEPTRSTESLQRSRPNGDAEVLRGRDVNHRTRQAGLPTQAEAANVARLIVGVSQFHTELGIGHSASWAILHLDHPA